MSALGRFAHTGVWRPIPAIRAARRSSGILGRAGGGGICFEVVKVVYVVFAGKIAKEVVQAGRRATRGPAVTRGLKPGKDLRLLT